MTPRENLLAVLRREGMEEVPFDISLSPHQQQVFRDQTAADDPSAWFRLQHRFIGVSLTPTGDTRGFFNAELPEGTTFDRWGVAHAPGSAAAMHMTRLLPPLAGDVSLGDVESYPLPEVGTAQEVAEAVRVVHDAGYAAMGGMGQTIWETAWAIRSMEDLMVDMLDEDERATVLLDRITEIAVRRAVAYAQGGCDIVLLGDDIGMQSTPMMSVDLWRRELKPRLARVIDAIRGESADTQVFYHSCGFVEPFIDDLIDVGVQILNPVQPESMSFASLHNRYSDRLSFWGTIGTQTTMPFGTPEEVRAEVWANVARCRDVGGLVIGPTHLVEPEVPWENILAIREACDTALSK